MKKNEDDHLSEEHLSGTINLGNDLHWENSANVLCKYMEKQEYLDSILQNSAFIPRYVIEPLDYLNLKGIKEICFPMVCFCDIPLSKVATHMSHYGEYGIGLDKNVVLKKYRIQPIHYINGDSPLADDFREAFQVSGQGKFSGDAHILADYLLSTLMYMKPIWGLKTEKDGNKKICIYQDECEWRYIPSDNFPKELGSHLILKQWETTEKAKDIYSDVLTHHEECWLKFEWSEVRYIMVPDEFAVRHTISIINNLNAIGKEEKDMLISKIEISGRFSANM